MPSSSSVASTSPRSRARRKFGSRGIESSETNPNTTLRTFPARHSRPTSGPPKETTVRSVTLLRRTARTSDMGLRREPHPPMPMVMPSRSSAANSSWVRRLSATWLGGSAALGGLLQVGPPDLPPHVGQVQLEREALFEPVAPAHVGGVDAVQGLLGPPDD